MTVSNANGGALRAMAATRTADLSVATSMKRLSTGNRVNLARDDAAGLNIAAGMTTQIIEVRQGIRNALDGKSLMQIADSVLGEVSDMAQRLRELTLQSLSCTYSDQDRGVMQVEVSALTAQIGSALRNANLNGKPIFASSRS